MYILEGNIGAGKSTLLTMIQSSSIGVDAILEPVNAWHKQDIGQSLLAQFYGDIKRWAFSLETYAMACRVKEHLIEQQNPNPYRLFERSIYSGHFCFAHNSFKSGGLSEMEWSIYQQWFDFLMHKNCRLPNGFIYLKTDPTVCFERVKRRARAGEEQITLQYLEQISTAHDEFLLEKKNVGLLLASVPVLVLDGNVPFVQSKTVFNEFCDTILEFMHKTNGEVRSTQTHRLGASL